MLINVGLVLFGTSKRDCLTNKTGVVAVVVDEEELEFANVDEGGTVDEDDNEKPVKLVLIEESIDTDEFEFAVERCNV